MAIAFIPRVCAPETGQGSAQPAAADMKKWKKDDEEERRERRYQRRLEFEALFADWLENRAAILRTNSDDEMERLDDRDIQIARRLATTPSPRPYCIGYKVEIIEHYMKLDGYDYTDERFIVLFAGLKADLARFRVDDTDPLYVAA